MHRLSLGLTLLFAGLFAFAPGIRAQEMSASGYAIYVPHSESAVELADGSSAVEQTSNGYVLADDTESPFHLVAQDCSGTNLVGADGVLQHSSGYCSGRDQDDDMYWLSYWNTPDAGKWTLIGGTGKFEGVTGGGTSQPLAADADGTFAIRWDGTWTMR